MDKYTIKKWILPYLSVGKRGFKSKFDAIIIILLIFKRLKTGYQWRELPIEIYFKKNEISWKTVYYYFNKWSKDGSFKRVWVNLLLENHKKIDLSCVQLDDSLTRVVGKRGNPLVISQERKALRLILSFFGQFRSNFSFWKSKIG